jgi:nitrogen-specific signal transduction histidine kinase
MDLPIHTQIVEHLNTAVLLVNDHLGLEYINPAAELLLGVRAAPSRSASMNTCCWGGPIPSVK